MKTISIDNKVYDKFDDFYEKVKKELNITSLSKQEIADKMLSYVIDNKIDLFKRG